MDFPGEAISSLGDTNQIGQGFRHHSITVLRLAARPEPAGIGLVDLFPESHFERTPLVGGDAAISADDAAAPSATSANLGLVGAKGRLADFADAIDLLLMSALACHIAELGTAELDGGRPCKKGCSAAFAGARDL